MASPKKGYPNRNEGLNGDLSINITPNGLGLFGKVKDKWYRFGSAQEESRRGNVNTSQNSLKSDYSVKQLNADIITINDAKEIASDTDKFLMSDNGTIKYVTGANLLSYTGGSSTTGTVTSVGTTGTVNGITLTGTVTTSGNLTLGGTLTINNGDWSGTALADGNIASASTWNAKQDALTFGISNTNAVKIDAADVADDEYARFTANGLESRTLGEIKTDIGTGNSALVPSAGTSGHFLKHDGTFGQVAYSNLSGTPTIPTNYVTDDADDTMAGTLTIDKDSTATTTTANYGQFISVSHTGDTAGGNTITNEGIHVEITNHTGTHTGTHNMIGISTVARTNTTGTSTVHGIYNQAQAGDTVYGIYNESTAAGTTGYGIYQKVDDGDTDYIQVSSANTADYFKMSTTANGATTLQTIDADARLAHLKIRPDGKLLMEMSDMDGEDDAWAITNNDINMMTFKTEGGAENFFKIYEAGATNEDYFEIEVQQSGETYIQTVDAAGADAHLNLNPDGQLRMQKSVRIKEQASADADQSSFGQLWVKSNTPNNLYFTDDTGQDVQITNNGSLAGGGGSSGLNSIVAAMVFG